MGCVWLLLTNPGFPLSSAGTPLEQMQPLRNVNRNANGFYFFVPICSNVQPEQELNIAPLPTNPVNCLGPTRCIRVLFTHTGSQRSQSPENFNA